MGKPFSYTRVINKFDSCPFAYKREYIDKIKPPQTEPLFIGALTHEGIAQYDRLLTAARQQTDLEGMGQIIRTLIHGQPHPFGSSALMEVEDVLNRFARSHIMDPESVVSIDQWAGGERGLRYGSYTIWAKIDRLQIKGRRGVVTDYKTDRAVRSVSDIEKDFQLRFYAWVTLQEFPSLAEFSVALDFVRYGVRREVELPLEEVKRVGDYVDALMRRLDSTTEFEARPGDHCEWCPFKLECPAAQQISQEVTCRTAEDATRIAGELSYLEAAVALRKKLLKTWTNVNGAAVNNGIEYGYSPVQSHKIDDVQGFIDLLRQFDRDPAPHLAVTSESIKALRSDPDIGGFLEPLLVDASYTRFDGRKVKGEMTA